MTKVPKKLKKAVRKLVKEGMTPYQIATRLEAIWKNIPYLAIYDLAEEVEKKNKDLKIVDDDTDTIDDDDNVETNALLLCGTETCTFTLRHPTVEIPLNIYQKLVQYVNGVDIEISGVGTTHFENNKIIIEDVYLLEQEGSAGHTEISSESVSKLMVELIQKNIDTSKLNFWWHSHGNGATFWSGTDDKACEELKNKNMTIAIVLSQKHAPRCRIDLYEPFRITMDNIKVNLMVREMQANDKEIIKLEIEQKVKKYDFSNNLNNSQVTQYKARTCGYECYKCPAVTYNACGWAWKSNQFGRKDVDKPTWLKDADKKVDQRKELDKECKGVCRICPTEKYDKCILECKDEWASTERYLDQEIDVMRERGEVMVDGGITIDIMRNEIIMCNNHPSDCMACKHFNYCEVSFERMDY